MNTESIFIKPDEINNDNISGKITYTNILEIIPKTSTPHPLANWKNLKKIEWRWRFLKFNERFIVEISYQKYNDEKRTYFNQKGQWVQRSIDPSYDNYVIKEFYYYTID